MTPTRCDAEADFGLPKTRNCSFERSLAAQPRRAFRPDVRHAPRSIFVKPLEDIDAAIFARNDLDNDQRRARRNQLGRLVGMENRDIGYSVTRRGELEPKFGPAMQRVSLSQFVEDFDKTRLNLTVRVFTRVPLHNQAIDVLAVRPVKARRKVLFRAD